MKEKDFSSTLFNGFLYVLMVIFFACLIYGVVGTAIFLIELGMYLRGG